MAQPRAIIIGAGIAGLSAAIALRQAGWAVEVYEQAPVLEPMGAALSLWPNAMAALDQLGCGDALRARAQPIETMALRKRDGSKIMEVKLATIVGDHRCYLPERTVLQSVLLAGAGDAPLYLGHRLASFEDDGAEVVARFDNGAEARGDLLIAADGIHSAIAQKLTGVSAHHAGYGGVLLLTNAVDGGAISGECAEYWAAGERFGLLHAGGSHRYCFYMRDEHDPRESREITLDFLRARLNGWNPAIKAALDETSPDALIPFSVHAKQPPKSLGRGRIALIGDAAHAMEPNLGQGGCQALEDSIALGVAARGRGAADAVQHYEKLRLRRVRKFVSESRQGAIISHRLPTPLVNFALSIIGRPMEWMTPWQLRKFFKLPDYA